jgi:hypothetical protein
MTSPIKRRLVDTVYAGCLLGALCFSSASYSQTPFPAIFSSSASVQEGSNAGFTDLISSTAVPGSVSVGPGCINVVDGGCGMASASSSASLDVSVSGSSTAASLELPDAGAVATVTLYYYVIGPSAAYTAVPMIFSGNYSGSASGAMALASAEIQLSSTSGAISANPCATGYTSSTCSSSFTGSFLFDSANGFSVFSSSVSSSTYDPNEVTVAAQGSTAIAGQFSAQIDPTLEIDPTWLATHPGYSLVLSPNVSAVPLPASVWLMLSALGGLGLIVRRRAVARR